MRAPWIALVLVLASCSTAPYTDPSPPRPPLPAPADGSRRTAASPPKPSPAPEPTTSSRTRPVAPAPIARGIAVGFLADVFATPSLGARIIGWIQTGRTVDLGERIGDDQEHCPQGWYSLADGRGFVCAGRDIILGRADRRTTRGTAVANLEDAVPYRYAVVNQDPGTPRYNRWPTLDERAAREAQGESAIDGDLVGRYMRRGYMVSVRGLAGHTPNAFWSCLRGGYVRYEHAHNVRPSPFAGVDLVASGESLPIAFLTAETPWTWRADGDELRSLGPASRLSHFDATRSASIGGVPVLARHDGILVRADDVSVVRVPPLPADLAPGERWIDVSLADQTLVAMQGDRPVFATVVSTGLRTPTRQTPPGTFHVQAKHVTASMDQDVAGARYSIEDVPWTMFYDGSLALHGAFWHDQFGHPKSHGCVNLSARDAKWLFQWAGPTLPPGWYGMLATEADPGTRIVIR